MYIENPDEEQNKNQSSSSPAIGAGGGGAASPTTTATTPATGNPSTIQPVQTNQPNQSFATIQDYLGANKPQGETLGNQFVGTVGQGLNTAKSAIDTSAQNAQNQITSGTVKQNTDLTNEALKTPTAVTGDAGKLAEFQKEYNAQYSGPSSLESSDQYENASKAANEASQTGEELKTTGGREQILQDKFGVYGQGNKGLDQGLLQNSSAYSNVAPLQQGFQSVQDYLKAASGSTADAAKQARETTEATKANTQKAFAGNLSSFQDKLNSEVSVAQQAAQTAGSKIQTDIKSGNLDALSEDLQKAGVSPENLTTISQYLQTLSKDYGQNPEISNYFTQNPITAANVASPEEYANAQAYKQLTGTDYSGVLNPADAAKAGTANPNASVNPQELTSYLKQSVDTQDKSLVNTNPTLDWNAINAGKVSSDEAVHSIQKIIDAGKRQGIDPANNPALQSMESNAFQAVQAVVQGRGDLTSKPFQTYMNVAKASLKAKGQSEEQAHALMDSWIQALQQKMNEHHKTNRGLDPAIPVAASTLGI